MKKQQPARLWLPTALALALFVLAAVWMVRSVHVTAGRSDQESLRLAEQALRRAAVSCYALEGAYPASYDDLKQRSGLAIDEERYMVFYEIFASNVMPQITVVERGEEP